jgi:adenylate cyclase
MSIRLKIILIVLPLVVAALLLTGVSSYFAASNGISRVAREFLAFKASQLEQHAQSQWSLLVENGLTGRPEMVEATREAVAAYAASLATSETELTAAFGVDGSVLTSTAALSLSEEEKEEVSSLALGKNTDYLTVTLGGVQRVAKGFWFEPFGWYVLVTEQRSAFYAGVTEIWVRTLIILGAAIAASVVLVLVFVGWLTRPLARVVASMRQIIETNDLGERVEVEYQDEIGQLAQTFNLMVEGLEVASGYIRGYARASAISRTKENRFRNVFQMYVPKVVIDQHIANPALGLHGENREIAVLSSDIRGFTSISEPLQPDELVSQLNRYFSRMVEVIDRHGGYVDKYIGDAIKALFGAPDRHEDDALRATLSAIEMTEALEGFNREQKENGSPSWNIGVGVAYGRSIVGNVGCEKKMNYTAFGRIADLASELEGATKRYRVKCIISEMVQRRVKAQLPCRLLDFDPLGGIGRIYTAKKNVEGVEREAWDLHNEGMEAYLRREHARAAEMFERVCALIEDDAPAALMLERCRRRRQSGLPAARDGAEIGEPA